MAMMVSQGNIDRAGPTAAAFARAIGEEHTLGLQTDDLNRTDPAFTSFLADRRSEPWTRVFLWDRLCDAAWTPTPGMPIPFFPGEESFSYGGAYNRLLMLAVVAEADLLIRVDAGASPHPDFPACLAAHQQYLDDYAVVSGRYDQRLALRDDFLPEADRAAFHSLIQNHVGIDPCNQLTAGACFALRVAAGPPAIAFPGFIPVYASDDGFYQLIAANTLVNRDLIVGRNAPGQPLPVAEYLVRLACAAALTHIHRRANLRPQFIPCLDEVVTAGKSLLNQLHGAFPHPLDAFQRDQTEDQLHHRAAGLIAGYENYIPLLSHWPDICGRVQQIRPSLLRASQLR